MYILGIETSCDETALFYANYKEKGETVQINDITERLYSQAAKHSQYGGVYPSLAKREHQTHLPILTNELIKEIPTTDIAIENKETEIQELLKREPELLQAITKLPQQKPRIDGIAVTVGPGLAPALWIGVNWARALATLWNLPIIPVNHMEGHIVASLMEGSPTDGYTLTKPEYPLLALLVSGGHTELVFSKSLGNYTKIGATKDDAVGEAFDKVARLMDLPYPGGPAIAQLAQRARETKQHLPVEFPRPMINDGTYSFSYSGLKTAVRRYLEEKKLTSEEQKEAIACAFEDAAIEPLVYKTRKAVEEYQPKTLIVGGGVSANTYLRHQIHQKLHNHNPDLAIRFPHPTLATDNATMIATIGYLRRNDLTTTNRERVAAQPNLSL